MMYFILRLFSSLPLVVLQFIGAVIGLFIYLLSSRYRSRLNDNLQSAAISSGFIADRFRAACESGMMFADTLWIWRHPKSALKKATIVDLEKVIALTQSGRGLIILAPHLGGFEIVPRIFAEHMKATVMYRAARKSWLNQLMLKSRLHPNMEFVEANLGGVRKIKRALKNGEVIGLLADQVPSVGDGIWAKFFKQYAYTTSLPIKLTRLNDIPTLFVSAERLPFGRGWLIKNQLMKEKYPECLIEACTKMNGVFEELIVSKPNQYLWSYNRYKTPLGAELRPINL